ncbi:hypothetical protein M0R45_025445 [Rubus argutus]|uniref:Bet v I/Major latex protein domain-containing protein n=1 Tax=Rubus argutus TaxID=59490 RepID=A0AAW1WVG7_RUBAR
MSSKLEILEADVEINVTPVKFHEYFTRRPHHISNVSPGKIQGCDLHEGDWGTVGSIIYWNYFHDGKAKVAKQLIEAIDDETNSITLKVSKEMFWRSTRASRASFKPARKTLLQFLADLSKDIGGHLVTQA